MLNHKILLIIVGLIGFSCVFADETGYIRHWEVIGPFSKTANLDVFENDWLEPWGSETGLSNRNFQLNTISNRIPITLSSTLYNDGYLDFNSIHGSRENAVTYAICNISTDQEKTIQLLVGSDDGLKIWANGNIVFRNRIYRGAVPDQEEIYIHLQKGNNRLLFKVEQMNQGWGLYVRINKSWNISDSNNRIIPADGVQPFILLTDSENETNQRYEMTLMNQSIKTIDKIKLNLKLSDDYVLSYTTTSISRGTPIYCQWIHKSNDIPSSSFGSTYQIRTDSGELIAEGPLLHKKIHLLLQKDTVSKETIRFVHLTDTHISYEGAAYLSGRPFNNLRQAVKMINSLNPTPDFVIITGDLIKDNMKDFDLFYSIMSGVKFPLICTMGNQDKPQGLYGTETILYQWGYPSYYSFNRGTFHFVVLNTAERNDRTLSEEQKEWLKTDIEKYKGVPTILFSHRDLVTGFGINTTDDITEYFKDTTSVIRVFSGGLHANVCLRSRNNLGHMITPSIAYPLTATMNPETPYVAGFRVIDCFKNNIVSQFVTLGGGSIEDPPITDYKTLKDLPDLFPSLITNPM